MTLAYQQEPWFQMLRDAVNAGTQRAVSKQLGLSDATVSQVLNGTGLYGTGTASTKRIAERVVNTYANWPCPFLGEEGERVISAAECRSYAHRDAPTTSPRDLQHWRACRECPMKSRSAPPEVRVSSPRPKAQAEPVAANPQESTNERV